MNASPSLLRRGRFLALAAVLALPAAGQAQTTLYQWDFDPSGGLAPTATGGGVGGGTLSIANTVATTGTVDGAGITGLAGDYGLDQSSTQYNTTNPASRVTASLGSFPTLTAMTVSLWVKSVNWATSAGTANARLLQLNSASGLDGDKLYFSLNAGSASGNTLQVGINSTGTGTINTGAVLPNTGSDWVFVSFTWDSTLTSGQNISTYLGNTTTSVAQAGSAFGAYTTSMASVSALSIGNRDTGSPSRSFDGVIDDIRIFSGALSQAQLETVRLEGIGAIPEPASCAAILGGLALAGVALRRRHRACPGTAL